MLFRQVLREARPDLPEEEITSILQAAFKDDRPMNMMEMDLAIRTEWLQRGYERFWPEAA
jgi:hypothetical protein